MTHVHTCFKPLVALVIKKNVSGIIIFEMSRLSYVDFADRVGMLEVGMNRTNDHTSYKVVPIKVKLYLCCLHC